MDFSRKEVDQKLKSLINIIETDNLKTNESKILKIFNYFMDSEYTKSNFENLTPFLKISKINHTRCIIFILYINIFQKNEFSNSIYKIKRNIGLNNDSDKEETFFNSCASKSSVFKNSKILIKSVYSLVTSKNTPETAPEDIDVKTEENQKESEQEDDILQLSYDEKAMEIICTTYENIVKNLKEIIPIAGIDNELKTEIKELETALNDFKNKVETAGSIKKIDKFIKNLKSSFDNHIKALKNKCSKCDFDKETLAKLNFKYLYTEALETNTNLWKKSKGRIKMRDKEGNTCKTKITTTPINNYFEYENNKRGISSRSASTSSHAANIWINKIEDESTSKNEDTSENNDKKTLFSAIRFANTRGKESATKELLLALALQSCNFDMDKLLDTTKKYGSYKFNIGNIQLMSPTNNILKKFGLDGDMPFKQVEKIKELCDNKKTITISVEYKNEKHTIRLEPQEILLFNFGSNDIHYSKILGLLSNKTKSYKLNLENMKKLFGENFQKEKNFSENSTVGKYVNTADSQKAEIIKQLSEQIINMWNETKGMGYPDDRFGIQARLSVLLYYLGYQVSFNCKSGKDRTGIMAVEANFIVQKIKSTGKVPEYNTPLSPEDKALLRELYKKSGVDQVTASATGFRGTKVSEVNRIGNTAGTSKHTKA